MKGIKNLNLNRYKLLNILFNAGIWYLILREPAAIYARDILDFSFNLQVESWLVAFLFIAGLWAVISREIYFDQGSIVGLGYLFLITAGSAVAYFLNWHLELFIPLAILLTVVSLRQAFYGNRVDYSSDIPRLTLIYLFSILVSYNFQGQVLIWQILLFFILILAQAVTIKIDKQQLGKGFTASYGPIIIFFLIMLFAAIIFAIPFQLPLLAVAGSIAGQIYQLIRPVLYYFIMAIFYLIYPVMLFIRWIFSNFISEGQETEAQSDPRTPEDNAKYLQKAIESPDLPLAEIVTVIILIIIGIYLIKRLTKSGTDDDNYLSEERESLSAPKMFINDLGNLWNKVTAGLGRNKKAQYDLNQPCQAVRYYYYKFSQLAAQDLIKEKNLSARDYKDELIYNAGWQEEQPELDNLISIYEKARYKEEVDDQEVEIAARLWQQLKIKRENRAKD
ncbi:MAG: hypothetical protein ACOC1W_03110 [Bacillota bacterium]